jgi:hypothetical protein
MINSMLTLYRGAALAISLLALTGMPAHATSPQEQTIFSAPLPHQLHAGGPMVKVHRARLDGYLDFENGDAAALAELKERVQQCTRALAASGRALHPPTVWPDHMSSHRDDQYSAPNRNIRYTSGVSYVVNGNDCSLIAEIASSAMLSSSKGVCKIDLVRKTARGECDASGHADARPEPQVQDGMADVIRKMAANPAMAAAAAQLTAAVGTGAVRGGQRTVAGVRCTDWRQQIDPQGTIATLCYATGGSFVPFRAVNQEGLGGLLLANTTPHGLQLKAVDARLDTQVGNAVFAPYMAPGFTLERSGQP